MKQITPEDRRRLADLVHVNEASLYQALTGKGAGFKPAECVRIEHESQKELMRWDLRPNDWHLIWPELIGSAGAPRLPMGDIGKKSVAGAGLAHGTSSNPRRTQRAHRDGPNHTRDRRSP